MKAATADNELQFIEVSNTEVADVLFPKIKPTNKFLGVVKSEPERYTIYGELMNWCITVLTGTVFHNWCECRILFLVSFKFIYIWFFIVR